MTDFATEVLPAPTLIETTPTSNGVEFLPAGVPTKWKNLGYYIAGAVWESWDTTNAPGVSPNPNTGHAVTGVSSTPEPSS